MRSDDAIPDAPVYTATLAEMENLEELLAKANEIAMKYGAVRIDPPSTWARPPLRMGPKSRFFVRMQTLPAAPFVDPHIVNQANTPRNHPRKRGRRTTSAACGEDSDDPVPMPKQQKTTGRDRAARAASRSQRNHLKPFEHDKQALIDHLANADFHSERTTPYTTRENPPNPHCTPVPSPPPELRGPATKLPAASTEQPSLLMPTQQSFARPSSREPYIQPSSASSGQSQAVQEAALRLAEAFTGSAKAGPAQNATAIPPCPFSQQTAQEHMAKRTGEEQHPFPLQKPVPSHPRVPPTLAPVTTQAVMAKGRNALVMGSACGIMGESVGVQARTDSNGTLNITNTKPHASATMTALPNNQTNSFNTYTPTREAQRKDWSRLAIGHYVDGKDDAALLLDDTRIPRINSQSIRPFSAPKQIFMRTPSMLPRVMDNGSNHTTHIPSRPPLNSRNNVSTAFPAIEPFIPKEPPSNEQTLSSAYHNAKQPGFIGMNVRQTGSHVRPHPSSSHNVHAMKGKEHISSAPQPGHFPILRSVPLQSYGSQIPGLSSTVKEREIDIRHRLSSSETNAFIQRQRELPHSHGDVTPGGADKGVAALTSSAVLAKFSAAEKHRSEYLDVCLPTRTPEETTALCEQKKEVEYPSVSSAAEMVPVKPLADHFKTEHKPANVARKREQRQIPDLPFDDAARLSNIPLKSEDMSNQSETMALATNVVTPPTQAKEISNGMPSQILAGIHSASAAHPLASQPASLTFVGNVSRSFSPKPREAPVVSGSDRRNAWNSSHNIVEEILAIATRSFDTEPLRAQAHKKEEGKNHLQAVAIHSVLEQADPNEGPNNQPAAELRHVSHSTRGMSPLFERTPGSCRDQQCLLEIVTQRQEQPHARDSQVHARSPHPIKLAALVEQHPRQQDIAGMVSGNPLPVVPNRVNVAGPESTVKDPSRHQQTSSYTNLRDSTETAEDLVVVSETRKRQHGSHPPMNSPKPEDIIHLDDEKPCITEPKQKSSKPTGKRTAKRKIGFRSLQVDQDEVGRLTKAIVFPDSGTPISLASYEKTAQEHHEETRKALNGAEEERGTVNNVENVLSKLDLCDVDTLEKEFWKAMSAGIHGRPVTVAYGVDVEAEGAFDSNEMSYVEWHGAQPGGSTTKKRKRGRPRIPKRIKPGNKQQPTENTGRQPNIETPGILHNESHEDADDGMDCNGDSIIERSEPRAQMERVKLNPRDRKNKRLNSPSPRSHVGTLNRDGLLRHMPRMPGINHSMYYVGQLFTRFCWHTEDAFLNSVSYLHHGSAEKVWYAVPPVFAPAFEEFAASSVFSPSLLGSESAGRVLLMNKTTMFDPRRVRRKGVAVYRVVHKPGSFVLTAPRAYHAGFNCGFNIAEAVNFANPTWFPVGREASLFARQAIKPLCVPWEYLLFHEAKSLRDISNGNSNKEPSLQRLESNARVVAKEFKAIIIDGEQKIRKFAEAQNCRVSMLHEISGLAKHNQLGPEFGNGAGMVCSLCSHTCHFYAEMCGSCDDTFEARCVDHFGKGHRLCLYDSHKTVIVRRHDPVLLLDILGCLEKLAGITVDAHDLAQRYVGYLRTWQTPLRTSGLRLRLNLKAATSRLPPKVCKEKGDREKIVKAKIIRDKTHREQRRKIRKPVGSFARAGGKGKSSLHAKAEILRGTDAFTAVETSRGLEIEGGRDSKRVFNDVRDAMSKFPLL